MHLAITPPPRNAPPSSLNPQTQRHNPNTTQTQPQPHQPHQPQSIDAPSFTPIQIITTAVFTLVPFVSLAFGLHPVAFSAEFALAATVYLPVNFRELG